MWQINGSAPTPQLPSSALKLPSTFTSCPKTKPLQEKIKAQWRCMQRLLKTSLNRLTKTVANHQKNRFLRDSVWSAKQGFSTKRFAILYRRKVARPNGIKFDGITLLV